MAQYAAGYAGELHRLGYTHNGARKQLGLFAHLSTWLDGEGLKAEEIREAALKEYLQARRDAGYTEYLSERALQLGTLRSLGTFLAEPD